VNSDDLHAPTNAGPELGTDVPVDKSPTFGAPGATGAFGDAPVTVPFGGPDPAAGRPEVLVGAAFAGGMVVALVLRRFGR